MNQKYSEKKDRKDYTLLPGYEEIKPFTVEGDDSKYHFALWESMLKDCAFYQDYPSLTDEKDMKSKLKLRYDSLVPTAWRPPYQSRRDLLTWACEKRNAYMTEREAPEEYLKDCANYGGLLNQYGPDYNLLRAKLGHVRGLFD